MYIDRGVIKFFTFSCFAFFSAAALNILYLSGLSFFLVEQGPQNMPMSLIISGGLVFLLSTIFSFLNSRQHQNSTRYLNIAAGYFIFTIIFAAVISSFGFISKHLFSQITFIFAYFNMTLTRIFIWILLGAFYTPLVAKRNISFFTCFFELGIIITGLIYSWCYNQGIISMRFYLLIFVILSTFVGVTLFFLIPLRGKYKTLKFTHDLKKEQFVNKSWRWLFFSLSAIFVFIALHRVFFYYIFNFIVKETFITQERIGVILGIFTSLCSVAIIIANAVIIPAVIKRESFYSLFFIFTICLVFITGLCYLFPFWAVIFIAEFLRRVLSSSIFFPYSNYISTTLSHRKRYVMKVYLEGNIRQLGFIIANVILLKYVTLTKLNIVSIVWTSWLFMLVLFLAVLIFRKVFINYHILNLSSPYIREQMRSIEALGERKNIYASKQLLALLEDKLKTSLRKNIILSLGNIRCEDYLKQIFKQIEFPDQATQLATLEAISQYKSFKAQSFLFGLLFSSKLKSFKVRISLIRLIGKMFGRKLIPVLMLGLEDDDPRIVANTIEVIGEIRNLENVKLLSPYLSWNDNRIRAQAIIALYHYPKMKKECRRVLHAMLESPSINFVVSGLYAVGRLKLKFLREQIIKYMHSKDTHIRRNAILALIKLNYIPAQDAFVTLLLDDSEAVQYIEVFAGLSQTYRARVLERIELMSLVEREKIINDFVKSPFNFDEEINDLRCVL